jgi:hypothetical protein
VPDADRQLLEEILRQTRETNGRVGRLEEEVFGLQERQTDGLIRQVAMNTQFREQQQWTGRLVKWVVTPSTLITALTLLVNTL